MGKRKTVTTRDIAEALELSQSTVSMILSERPGVSFTPETIARVRNAARQMGYEKTAPKLPEKNRVLKDTIAVICPKLSGGYYSMLLHSIIARAKAYRYTVLTVTTLRESEAEAAYLELLSKTELAGIITLYPMSRIRQLNALSRQIPVISVGDRPDSCRFDSVVLDSKKPGYLVGEHLLSLGHTQIVYISTPIRPGEVGRQRRLEGVRQSFADKGFPAEHIRIMSLSSREYAGYPTESAEYQNGYDLTCQALREHTKATAFVGNNDMAALGILGALAKNGCRIPADYSVCGFDNIALASMPQISLTTVEHASVRKGQEAVDLIHRKNSRDHAEEENEYTIRLEYEPRLIVRGSTGRAQKR